MIGIISILYGDINKYAIRVTYFDKTFSPGENYIFKNYGECVKWITENFNLPENGFSSSINNTYYAENGQHEVELDEDNYDSLLPEVKGVETLAKKFDFPEEITLVEYCSSNTYNYYKFTLKYNQSLIDKVNENKPEDEPVNEGLIFYNISGAGQTHTHFTLPEIGYKDFVCIVFKKFKLPGYISEYSVDGYYNDWNPLNSIFDNPEKVTLIRSHPNGSKCSYEFKITYSDHPKSE